MATKLGGIGDIWHSERGVVVVAALIAAAALVYVGKVQAGDWMDFAKWLVGIFVGGKTVDGSVRAWAAARNGNSNGNGGGGELAK